MEHTTQNLKADPHSDAEGITDTQLSDRPHFGPSEAIHNM